MNVIRIHLSKLHVVLYTHPSQFREVLYALSKRSIQHIMPMSGNWALQSSTLRRQKGSEHQCTAEGCGKRSEPCEHHTAKCASCGGPHMATSRSCPKKRSTR
jgi:hypothetical protein